MQSYTLLETKITFSPKIGITACIIVLTQSWCYTISVSARRVHPRTKICSSAAGVDLWWSANHIAKRFRATRRSGFLFFPEGRRPRWEVDPPLRVREDWWVFEDFLRLREDWWVFEKTLKVQGSTGSFSNVKEVLVGFRKTSLALREVFRKPFQALFSKK